MKRYPGFALILTLSLLGSACASKEDLAYIARRVGNLEDRMVDSRSETVTIQEDIRDQDLRLQFLEYEAVQRGEPIAPRRSMSTPDPSREAGGGQVVRPETAGPGSTSPAPGPVTPAAAESAASPATPSVAPSPVTPSPTPSPDAASPGLPPSPASSASPSAPGALPAPEHPVSQPVESSVDVPRGSQIITEAPDTSSAPARTGTESLVASRAPAQPEQRAYDAALQMYRTGRFPQSEAAFQAFLEVYPDSGLVPNALYWKGETFYARTMFADAIFAFKDVQTRFPQNQKTPDSLLKTAMAYQKLGDTANASLHLAALYEDWPNSEATRRARRMGLRP